MVADVPSGIVQMGVGGYKRGRGKLNDYKRS